MIANKIIININKLTEIEEYKKIGITNFLFAVKDFSIGYQSFLIDEIKNIDANIYLLFNRIMDTKTIEQLKDIKKPLKMLIKVDSIKELKLYIMMP